MPTPLTRSFTLDELTFSQMAARQGIANVPNDIQIAALQRLCDNVLQPLRDGLGLPIVISSGFRCPALNRLVSGAADSQHLLGEAADIVCPAISADELFKRVLALDLPFDQLIYEGGKECVWVHVSFRQSMARHEILRATFPPAGGVAYAALTRDQASALQA
jgi:zinc D-Ala-D-Ala carboxypeptidase